MSNQSDFKPMPWWLQGDLQCGHCLQAYAVETAYRCAYCDDELCGDCVVEVRELSVILCRLCAEQDAAETGSSDRKP